MTRFVASLEYKGTHYHGWQQQPGLKSTVQYHLVQALSKVADEAVTVFCAGRTDKGVHATCQIIHFDTTSFRQPSEWLLGTNTYLPRDIRMHWFRPVSEDFHARHSAVSRRYCYLISNARLAPGLFHDYLTWCYLPLNISQMQKAARYLIGEHDFTSFRASQCQARSPIRILSHLNITQTDQFVMLDIQANGFLHHMVRNIAGALIAVGCAKKAPQWVDEVLKARDRKCGAVTAKANGLYLIHAAYPERFGLKNEVQYPPIAWSK